MTDIFSKQKRSEIMRQIKSKNTNIELKLRKHLYKEGIKYRTNSALFGKPDIVLTKYRIVIFCDGDFWHGKTYRKDKNKYNKFWKEKIVTNIKRDKLVNKILKKDGWKVIRFWKSDIQSKIDVCIRKIMNEIAISSKFINRIN